jgi:hypothetical protein
MVSTAIFVAVRTGQRDSSIGRRDPGLGAVWPTLGVLCGLVGITTARRRRREVVI